MRTHNRGSSSSSFFLLLYSLDGFQQQQQQQSLFWSCSCTTDTHKMTKDRLVNHCLFFSFIVFTFLFFLIVAARLLFVYFSLFSCTAASL